MFFYFVMERFFVVLTVCFFFAAMEKFSFDRGNEWKIKLMSRHVAVNNFFSFSVRIKISIVQVLEFLKLVVF